MFITLQMFIDQKGSKYSNYYSPPPAVSFTPPPKKVPFSKWDVGYRVRSPGGAEFSIERADILPLKRESRVELKADDGTFKVVGGGTLSRYDFVSGPGVEPAAPAAPPRSDVYPMTVNITGIREYYPRKNGKEGTRVLMNDKTAYVVADSYAEVQAKVEKAGGFKAR